VILLVTGTDTGVGKTITTAALAVALGPSVAVYKPTQAGLDAGLGDIDVVRRLAGIDTVSEGIRLPHPMAPVAAADRAGVRLPPASAHRARIAALADTHEHVLVEGAGGLLVELDHEGHVLPDLAPGAAAVVVCRSGLGTLNHTALTCEALAHRGVPLHGLVIGSWPAAPSEIERDNRVLLERRGLVGAIPEGAPTRPTFRTDALSWLTAPITVP